VGSLTSHNPIGLHVLLKAIAVHGFLNDRTIRFIFSSSNACLIIARVSVALFPRCEENRCRIHREIISGQMHDSKSKAIKKSEHPPSCVTLCTPTPTKCYTIIYCCIPLLQLLYRWQHQSLKLWTPSRTSIRKEQNSESHDFSLSAAKDPEFQVTEYVMLYGVRATGRQSQGAERTPPPHIMILQLVTLRSSLAIKASYSNEAEKV
jgi:hypothetical protein